MSGVGGAGRSRASTIHTNTGIAIVLALVALLLASCGGDDDASDQLAEPDQAVEPDQLPEADQAGDLDRYCELKEQTWRDLAEHVVFHEDTTPEDVQRMYAELLEQSDAIDELPAAAPEEMRSDVVTEIEGIRSLAGEEVEVSEPEFDAAQERVNEFDAENCEIVIAE